MGISIKIDTEEGIIYALAEGKIGPDDILAYRKDLRADPKYNPDFGLIFEFRLSNLGISDSEGKDLAAELPADFIKKSAVVYSEGSNKEFALRYKEWVKEKVLIKVFTDLGSAKKWITSD